MKHLCRCFLVTVNFNDYSTADKVPDSTDKMRIVPMKCRILQDKCRIVPIKCRILQIRRQIMCKSSRSINMYWKKALLFITTDKAVEILGVKYRRARVVLLSMVESG